MSNTIKCKHCGEENSIKAVFCKSCEKGLYSKDENEKVKDYDFKSIESMKKNIDKGKSMNSSEKPHEVYVKDIKMSFGSMVEFMVKLAFASIPAIFIICFIWIIINTFLIGFLSSFK